MPQTKRTVKGVLGGLLGLVGLSAVAGILVTATVTPAIAMTGFTGSQALTLFNDLPGYLKPSEPMAPTTIYGTGTDGKPFQLATFYQQNRIPVTFDQISPTMIDALLSSEDKGYYEHGGVNLLATIKAAADNALGKSSRGASTISQQYVKNVLIQECEKKVPLNDEKYETKTQQCWLDAAVATGADGIERKLREMRYALQIEKDYSKNDILLGYLNVSNFGGTTYGIEAAARYYFGVSSANLTLVQAATLAGMVNNPNQLRIDMVGGSWKDKAGASHNSKEDGYATTKERRNYVLDRMLIDGKITKAQHDEAKAAPVEPNIHPSNQGCGAAGGNAYYCQYVKSVLENNEAFGKTSDERQQNLKRGGMKVYTSLDMRVQQPALDVMAKRVPQAVDGMNLGAAAVSIEATSGRILSIVQNTRFSESASEASKPGVSSLVFAADQDHGGGIGFSVGSTYKIFTLLDWLENGRSVNEVLDGTSRIFKTYTACGQTEYNGTLIKNFGGGRGTVGTPKQFTSASLNTGFLAMAQELDTCDINKVAQRLGVHLGDGKPVTADNGLYASTLGAKNVAAVQMAGAFGTIANGGKFCEPRVIDKVVGIDGKEITPPASTCTQVLQPEVASTAAYTLQGVMNGGTGGASNPGDGTPVLGKTGTHEQWQTMMVESSTKVTTAVWVGNIKGESDLYQRRINGIQAAQLRHYIAPVIQRAADAAYPGGPFPRPDSNLTRNVLKDLPDVVGKTIDEAKSILDRAGFSVNVGPEVDSDQPAGTVAAQSPGAGKVAGGVTVTLSPSNGKGGTVPDVTGNIVSDAQGILNGAGYTNIDWSGNCKPGSKVQATDPSGGTRAAKSTQIRVKCE
ncbi:transglycosylase domain-containing protein [Microbacterium sp.]|uniref:transglycosylase domain-containing protein n=1 Tax=Microbacterium sp. TaxID=51671 RepID=UPI003340DAA1